MLLCLYRGCLVWMMAVMIFKQFLKNMHEKKTNSSKLLNLMAGSFCTFNNIILHLQISLVHFFTAIT